MWRRVRIVLASRLRKRGRAVDVPLATLMTHGLLAGVLCGLVRSELGSFGYALFAYALAAALVAIPLLGELGYLLRADEAEEWMESLPAKASELRIARSLHVLLVLCTLSAGTLVPAAVLAPGSWTVLARIGLLVSGCGQAFLLAAALLLVQTLLGGRAEALLVLLQTLLVVGVVVGLGVGLRYVHAMADWTGIGSGPQALLGFPPAWFAAPFGTRGAGGEAALVFALPAAALFVSAVVLVATPPPARLALGRRRSWLEAVLAPARALATRFWVSRAERGIFDLVYDALPREREFVLRTYPMLGIPLAFLLFAVLGEPGGERDRLLALLLFTSGIYLPLLVVHVPASASHAARWLHDCSPVSPAAVANGAIKAVSVRFVLPLYLVLGLLAWQQAGPSFALRLVLPAALTAHLVVRFLYARLVHDRPLSTAPDELETDMDWLGILSVLVLLLTVGALFAERYVRSFGAALILAAALASVEVAISARSRRS